MISYQNMHQNRHSKNIILQICIFILLGIIAGCSLPATGDTSAKPRGSISGDSEAINLPTGTNAPPHFSAINELPAPQSTQEQNISPTLSSTLTYPPIPKETEAPGCFHRKSENLPNFLESSFILFYKENGYYWQDPDSFYRLLDASMELLPAFDEFDRGIFSDFRVSKDGRWVAFLHEMVDENQKIIRNLLLYNPQEGIRTIPWDDENWEYYLKSWTNDHRLIIPPLGRKPREYEDYIEDEIIIFDPFSGKQEPLTPTFSRNNFAYSHNETWRGDLFTAIYDPSLQNVIYFDTDNSTGSYNIRLWNLHSDQVLWELIHPSVSYQSAPEWSPDGEYLAVAASLTLLDVYSWTDDPVDLFLVRKTGDEVVPIHQYQLESVEEYYSFTWSEDSRYLFYWIPDQNAQNTNENKQRLMIFDSRSRQNIDTCFVYEEKPYSSPFTKLFTSPDGREVLFSIRVLEGDVHYLNYTIDIQNRSIVELSINFEPVAWMRDSVP